jgi:hypothetical protein
LATQVVELAWGRGPTPPALVCDTKFNDVIVRSDSRLPKSQVDAIVGSVEQW